MVRQSIFQEGTWTNVLDFHIKVFHIFSHVSSRMLLIAVRLTLKVKLRDCCDFPLSRYLKVTVKKQLSTLTLQFRTTIDNRCSYRSGNILKNRKKYSRSNLSGFFVNTCKNPELFLSLNTLYTQNFLDFFSLWNFSFSMNRQEKWLLKLS